MRSLSFLFLLSLSLVSSTEGRAWYGEGICNPDDLPPPFTSWFDPSEVSSNVSCEMQSTMPPIAAASDEETPDGQRNDAIESYRSALRNAEAGDYDQAILELQLVKEAFPEIADRLAFAEAEFGVARGADERSCSLYEEASASTVSLLAMKARVARVRCLIAIGDPDAEESARALRQRFPELPQSGELDLLLARARQARGDLRGASQLYRRIDLRDPGSGAAAQAREALTLLRNGGEAPPPLNLSQQVERAGRLLRHGPIDDARRELQRLHNESLRGEARSELAGHAARLARQEGRWGEAYRQLQQARRHSTGDASLDERRANRARDMNEANQSLEQEAVTRRIRSITRGRPMRRLRSAQLFRVIRLASQAGLAEPLNRALDEVIRNQRMAPSLKFRAGILSIGPADELRLQRIFRSLLEDRSYGMRAHYYLGGSLARSGKPNEARQAFAEVVSRNENSHTPYYALWARQHLRTLGSEQGTDSASTDAASLNTSDSASNKSGAPNESTSASPSNPRQEEGEQGLTFIPNSEARRGEMLRQLNALVEQHGEDFPWLQRAAILLELNESDAADEELHTVYLAWSQARRRGPHATGLESVSRGGPSRPVSTDIPTRRRRRALDESSRDLLSQMAGTLGDPGLAIRFKGWTEANRHPRAYEAIVNRAAREHNIDPNLLLAVMRVESVYNRRVVSYAGAVGLMQIMPRTGTRIARRLGQEDFTVDQLLNPEVNIRFAAWYLSSLISRFDGRVPLAIASYNGGPHNVRRWMREHPSSMPLDAFLEHIPFTQTHRYVRRVLSHYAAYRAQLGQSMRELHTSLPTLSIDREAF